MPDDSTCSFCRIIDGDAPAIVVRRWEDAIAIVPLNPVTEGHTLVIPYVHVADALEDPFVTARTMQAAAELATPPCNLITSVGREATQSVFHLHLHVVPRRADDGLPLPWYSGRRSKAKAVQREATADADLIGWLRRRVEALERLAAHYRLGTRPSEKLHRELDATRQAIESAS